MYCTHCGQSITEGASSCQACGQPIAAPQAPVVSSAASPYVVARLGQRLVNNIIDGICIYVLLFIIALVASGLLYLFLAILIAPIYFIVMENVWQRTVGKFVTGTKVVTYTGEKAALWQIIGRSVARMIPFEALSFFVGGSVGWHDTLSETLVVSKDYSPEQVRAIDLTRIHNRKSWILIVILIIGVIASFAFVAYVLMTLSQALPNLPH